MGSIFLIPNPKSSTCDLSYQVFGTGPEITFRRSRRQQRERVRE
ncbi:hypothetical protein Lalb_Chr11g0071701 [Lupinus albus]|uniref:Uncharacterized protein n=1 Tax=Lupinus albus TaxID=3870 RepID=A0A6A4PRY3_LUPAL|nr:hypothetical protein Lalb_Chr11g0071701 [Lupinus albus]